MNLPESFPKGCFFVASFDGDEYVRMPNGKIYKLADSGRASPTHSTSAQGCTNI